MHFEQRGGQGQKLSPVKYRRAPKPVQDLLNPETLDDMTRQMIVEDVRRPEFASFSTAPYPVSTGVIASSLSPVSTPNTYHQKKRVKEKERKKGMNHLMSLRKKLPNGKTVPYHPLSPPGSAQSESSRGLSVGSGESPKKLSGGVRLRNLNSIQNIERLREIDHTSSGSMSSPLKNDFLPLPQASPSLGGVVLDGSSTTQMMPSFWKSTSSAESSSSQLPTVIPFPQGQHDILTSMASRLRESEQMLRIYQLELQETYTKLRDMKDTLDKAKKQNEEDEQHIVSLYEAKQEVEAELQDITTFLRTKGLEWDRDTNKTKAIPEKLRKTLIGMGKNLVGGGKRLGGELVEKHKEEGKDERKGSARKKESEEQREGTPPPPLCLPPGAQGLLGEMSQNPRDGNLPSWVSNPLPLPSDLPQESVDLYKGVISKDLRQLFNASDADALLRNTTSSSSSVREFVAREMEKKEPQLYNHQVFSAGQHGTSHSSHNETNGPSGGGQDISSSSAEKGGSSSSNVASNTSGGGNGGVPSGEAQSTTPEGSISAPPPSSLAMPPPPIDIALLQRNAQILSDYVGWKQIVTSKDGHKGCIRDREVVRVVIYKNGICVNNGPFRPFGWPLCEAFLQDLAEGYYPYEFKEKYPEGYPLEVTDRHEEECDPYHPQKSSPSSGGGGGGGSFASKNPHSALRAWENDGGYQPVSQNEFLQKLPVKAITSTGRLVDVRDTIASILNGGEKNPASSTSTTSAQGVVGEGGEMKGALPPTAVPMHHVTQTEIRCLRNDTTMGLTRVPPPSLPLSVTGTPTLATETPSLIPKKKKKMSRSSLYEPSLVSSVSGTTSLRSSGKRKKKRRSRTKQDTLPHTHEEVESMKTSDSQNNSLIHPQVPPRVVGASKMESVPTRYDRTGQSLHSSDAYFHARGSGHRFGSARSSSSSGSRNSGSSHSEDEDDDSHSTRSNHFSSQTPIANPSTTEPVSLPEPSGMPPLYPKREVHGPGAAGPPVPSSSLYVTTVPTASAISSISATMGSMMYATSHTLGSAPQPQQQPQPQPPLSTSPRRGVSSASQPQISAPPSGKLESKPGHPPVPLQNTSLTHPTTSPPQTSLVSLLIRMPSGQSLTLSLSPQDTIYTLRKEFLAAVSSAFEAETNFEFCRAFPPITFSDHNKTLASYGIGNRSALLVKLIK